MVTWNTNGGAREGTRTVLEAIGLENVNGIAKRIDVLSLQEQHDGDTDSILAIFDSLYGAGVYAAAPVPTNAETSGAGLPGLIYNTRTVALLESVAFGDVNTSAQARSTLRWQLKPADYGSSAAFYVYGNHYKASDSSSDRARRLVEASALRSDLDGLGDGISAVLSGDFNTYDSFESGYQALLAPGNGQAFDPVDAPGDWHDNANFKQWHTQSPATTAAFPGQVTGGVDDRFDFQLLTGELLDTEGVDLIPGSYRTFGNNGSHQLSSGIGTGTGASTEILAALESASDHLPVVADYQVPAIGRFFNPSDPTHAVELGSEYTVQFLVYNGARVQHSLAADELNYRLLGGGAVVSPLEHVGTKAVSEEHDTIEFTLDTSTIGWKEATIDIELLSKQAEFVGSWVADLLPARVEYYVAFSGDYNADGVVNAADYTVWRDNEGAPWDTVPNIGPGRPFIESGAYNRWRLNYGNEIGDALGEAATAPEPAAVLLLLGMVAAPWRRR